MKRPGRGRGSRKTAASAVGRGGASSSQEVTPPTVNARSTRSAQPSAVTPPITRASRRATAPAPVESASHSQTPASDDGEISPTRGDNRATNEDLSNAIAALELESDADEEPEGPESSTATTNPVAAALRAQRRQNLLYRPASDCAADSRHFRKSKVLYYTFMTLTNVELDNDGKLIRGDLRCSMCAALGNEGPQWTAKAGQKSTSNYKHHFEGDHAEWWAEAQAQAGDAVPTAQFKPEV